jgi:adenosylmethionine-8-amino-7-oxononanoate aminotransferase
MKTKVVTRHKAQGTKGNETRAFFVTGTDTGVGKTVATLALAVLLQQKGLKVGVMKPVQCGGDDAAFLKKRLKLAASLAEINPCYAPEPLSPHLAFKRAKKKIDNKRILSIVNKFRKDHDVLLVEGAGGLLVPLREDHLVADLARDMNAELIIVARLGLGTINHTLLTIRQAQESGLNIRGIVFSEGKGRPRRGRGLPEKTKPEIIRKLGGVPVLGTIPHLKRFDARYVVEQCRKRIDVDLLFRRGAACRAPTDLIKWDKKYLWHPFTQMRDWIKDDPLIIDEARGCYLQDVHGRRYLDGISSLWVNVHGHRHQAINAAVKRQLDKLGHSTLLGLSNTPAVELARRLVEVAPKGLEKVFYSDNGSTAVEIAVKMAYQYWQNTGQPKKRNIVHLNNSYHGDTLGSVSVGGIDLFHKVYRDLTFKTIQFELPDFYRGKGDLRVQDQLARLEALFKKKNGGIAALIVEPLIQGAAGMLIWPQGLLKGMERLCRKYDILLIADEVATGFGRTGKMFACEHENVRPDLLCLAKGLSGGYLPLAATLTTRWVYDGFLFDYKDQKTFFHGHTFTGNPLCCAAALANLDIFKKERTLEKLQFKIKYLSRRLEMFYNLPHVGDVRQKGLMAGIELVRDKKTKAPYGWQEQIGIKVCREARMQGVILRPLGNVIVLMPPLSISKAELEILLSVTYRCIEKVTGDGVGRKGLLNLYYDNSFKQ